ncbi:hypothetical protein PJ985_02815 [Streptomyces sp. ACA25]|uniref:hypothetical protein n=1 Tax=Streptomyces sp. ACA25 TaxID=3022596 RepID=UPI00230748B8|nr:hypothetical protein [Streptomyces sp. ACA25]MDB1086498.1 hypothetical protein [Streptomyces sp. ACA25]
MTLPSALGTPDVAQASAEVMLDVHEVEEKAIDPALLLVHALAVHACRFTGAGEMIHLGLHRLDNVLQVTVHDTHTTHTHRRLAAACDKRRRTSLAGVRELAEAHQGT